MIGTQQPRCVKGCLVRERSIKCERLPLLSGKQRPVPTDSAYEAGGVCGDAGWDLGRQAPALVHGRMGKGTLRGVQADDDRSETFWVEAPAASG